MHVIEGINSGGRKGPMDMFVRNTLI